LGKKAQKRLGLYKKEGSKTNKKELIKARPPPPHGGRLSFPVRNSCQGNAIGKTSYKNLHTKKG